MTEMPHWTSKFGTACVLGMNPGYRVVGGKTDHRYSPVVANFPSFCISYFLVASPLPFLPPSRFFKNGERYCLGSIAVSAVSAVSADVLPYISVAIKTSFLKLGMCNICKNNIAKMFLDFVKI